VDANQDANRWGALADSTRLAIVARLAEGPEAVGKLAAGLPVSRSAVSQHLKILKDAGVLSARRRGREIAYSIADEHVVHIALDAIAHAAER